MESYKVTPKRNYYGAYTLNPKWVTKGFSDGGRASGFTDYSHVWLLLLLM